MRTLPLRAHTHASGGVLTPASYRRSLLLLSTPAEEARARRLAVELGPSWHVVRPVPASDPAELRTMADAAGLVLHLDTGAASALDGTAAAEVYAPAGPACHDVPDPASFRALFAAERSLAARARLIITPDPAGCEIFHLLHHVPAARLRFIPERLLGELLPLALTPAPARAVPRVLLAFNDYPVDEAHAGGPVRIRCALRAFGQPAVLLTLAPRGRAVLLAPGVVQLAVPKTEAQRAEEAESRTLTGLGLEDVLSAAHALHNEALTAVVTAMAPHAGCAVFSHCYLAPLLEPLLAAAPGLPVVYDSHNVEATLKAALLADHPAVTVLVAYIATIERRLVEAAAVVLCCSDADAACFAPLARRIVAFPHGTSPQPCGAAPANPPRVGFLASAHPPNVAAARFIVEVLAPRFPAVTFEIVGSVCAMIESAGMANEDTPNVVLQGVVTEARKHALISGWVVALNPIVLGGGASVKLADYLANGVPSLSTPAGARGYPVVERGAGWIAELEGFPASLAALLDDPARRQLMASAAEALGRERSWSNMAAPAREVISDLMDRDVAARANVPGELSENRTVLLAPPVIAGAGRFALWAGTLPSGCLPLILGGEHRAGALWAQQLHLVLPGMTRALHLELHAPGGVEVVIYEAGNRGAILVRRTIDQTGSDRMEITLPDLETACMVEITTRPPGGMRLFAAAIIRHDRQGANAGAMVALDLATCHRAAIAPDTMQPGWCPSPATNWWATAQAQRLAEALAASGSAYERVLSLRELATPAGFFVVAADPARPFVHARARALGHAYGTDVVLAGLASVWLVPRLGACHPVQGSIARILVVAEGQCRALILPTLDEAGKCHAALARELKIPVIGPGGWAGGQIRRTARDSVGGADDFDSILKHVLRQAMPAGEGNRAAPGR